MKEEKTLVAQICVLSDALQKASGLKSFIIWVRYLFLKEIVSLEGPVSHNVVYYQQLSITRYQLGFYGNNYAE